MSVHTFSTLHLAFVESQSGKAGKGEPVSWIKAALHGGIILSIAGFFSVHYCCDNGAGPLAYIIIVVSGTGLSLRYYCDRWHWAFSLHDYCDL
jgi:hypothetical protein